MRTVFLLCLMFGFAASSAFGAEDGVWWEGERAEKTNFKSARWLSGKGLPNGDLLSGGDWLANAGKRKGAELFARYTITVPQDGDYHFWTRKFWKHGPFRWRFGKDKWQTCGRNIALADNVVFRKNICVNWVYLGKVALKQGKTAFEVRLLAKDGANAMACFDAFLLTKRPFFPRGKLKPAEKTGLAERGWWAFEPEVDSFSESPIDLRGLNEKVAGESGFVTRNGKELLRGDGKPIRFWGVNCGPNVVGLDEDSLRYLARKLAKNGVNLVRYHGPIFDKSASDPSKVDMAFLGKLHTFAHIMKSEGIYLELSFYFPLWFNIKPTYGIPGYNIIKNKRPFALLYFDPRMQAIYKSWAKALLTTPNPHSGIPLGKAPAVAFVEIINEDSFLFWTFDSKRIPRVQMEKLEKLYGDWLKARHGSLDKAAQAWGWQKQKYDSPAKGRMMLLDAWHMTAKGHGNAAKKRRMSDQVRFLVEHQRTFYSDMIRHFREELGAKCLIICSNWKTADAKTLNALERYTYTAGDVIDRHGYFGGQHKGKRASYAVDKGDTYRDRAGVREPAALPIRVVQEADYPHVISELGWKNPNRYKGEAPFVCATYGALQGIDGLMFFAIHGADWEWSTQKFPVALPSLLGQFPAAALIYRQGYVVEAPDALHENVSLKSLFALQGSRLTESANLDALRKADLPGAAKEEINTGRQALAFYSGRVTRSHGDSSQVTGGISPSGKVVGSSDKTMKWDYGKGVIILNTPKAQGVTGFLKQAGSIKLGDITITSDNEFATILIVALDNQPLATSNRILIQAMTEDKTYGWKTTSGKITNLGRYPLTVRNIAATVTFQKRTKLAATPLDANGYIPKGGKTTTGKTIRLKANAMYTIVQPQR
jgi:hypothetical protein